MAQNLLIKRTLSFSTRILQQQVPELQIEIISTEPLSKRKKMLLNEYFDMAYAKEGQKLNMAFGINNFLGPNEFQVTIDKKKMKVPHLLEMMAGKHIDAKYVSPPGKPKGGESRIFSVEDSPVYNGVARKLGYKPLKGYQHP